ncbi:hypothetical protein D3C87_1959310 [compost metagenome]
MPPKVNLAWLLANCISMWGWFSPPASDSRRCSSITVLRGRMTSCLGTSTSSVALAKARRWPSVATRLSCLPSATNKMPLR